MQEAIGGSEPVDDPDEETFPDPAGPDDDPTTIRPSPLPANLLLHEATFARPSSRGFAASLRGKVGKYELRDKLGRGAFGVVFTARDPSLDRDVAIKVLRPTHLTNQDIVQRFLQEARATARIAHPGIVTIHDCGRVETGSGATAFIAMELLSGESLTSRLVRCGLMAPHVAAEIARQVASALEAAHRADVLHRDLKPDNIYLVPDPATASGERVKVLDFGLAKLGQEGHTQLQTVFGTPRYMSPEQCRSAAQVDHRSDIYALGCILFELVTGRLPFEGDVRQLIERHQRATPPRATSLVSALPARLDELIAEMLAKDPMDRPQTMGAVQRALCHIIDGVVTLTETRLPRRPETWAIGTDPSRPRGHPRPPDTSRPVDLLQPRPPEPSVCRPLDLPRPELPVAPEPSIAPELPGPDPSQLRHAPRAPASCSPSEHSRPSEPHGSPAPAGRSRMSASAHALEVAATTETPTICDPGTPSGEILVPATAGDPPDDRPAPAVPAPARRHRRALVLGIGTFAAIAAAIAAAAAAIAYVTAF